MSSIWQTTNIDRKTLPADIKDLLDKATATDWLGPKNAPIVLKPNLVVSKPASGGATTHPEIAAGLIEYLLDYGFSDITVAEGSWVGGSTEKAFKICGYEALSKKYNIPLVDLQNDAAVEVSIFGEDFRICNTIAELEPENGSLINLPVLKGHGQTHLTCALKNLKGCIPNSEKRRYHTLGVHRPVAMLNTLIKPAFTLVDGLNGDPYWEEGGSPEKRDLLLLARDPVALDAYACQLLGIPAESVSYIELADKLGVGTSKTNETDICRLNPAVLNEKRAKKETNKEKADTRDWVNKLVDQKSACSACFGNLSGALREIRKESRSAILRRINSEGEKSILLGQGFRGKQIPDSKTGIGSCTCGSSQNNNNTLRGCPPSQAEIRKFIMQRFTIA